jgi:hypothetical protein
MDAAVGHEAPFSNSPFAPTEDKPMKRSETDDGNVLVAVKTPMMERGTSALLPRRMSVQEALKALLVTPPKDANSTRVIQQLGREISSTHDFMALNRQGQLVKIDPQRTTLDELAVPREIRTSRGTEIVPVAAFEVQSYAPVGVISRGKPCCNLS